MIDLTGNEWQQQWLDDGVMVHRTATVDAGAKIGLGSVVWHYSHIRSTATIGSDCVISQGCYVDAGVSIGHQCKIANGVQIYQGVKIGDRVFVGPNTTFTNDLHPRATTFDGKLVAFSNPEKTVVENGASIGAGCVILPVTIGEGAMIGAGAVVVHNVSPHMRLICRLSETMDPIAR